jgi:hypothetical protein
MLSMYGKDLGRTIEKESGDEVRSQYVRPLLLNHRKYLNTVISLMHN